MLVHLLYLIIIITIYFLFKKIVYKIVVSICTICSGNFDKFNTGLFRFSFRKTKYYYWIKQTKGSERKEFLKIRENNTHKDNIE